MHVSSRYFFKAFCAHTVILKIRRTEIEETSLKLHVPIEKDIAADIGNFIIKTTLR